MSGSPPAKLTGAESVDGGWLIAADAPLVNAGFVVTGSAGTLAEASLGKSLRSVFRLGVPAKQIELHGLPEGWRELARRAGDDSAVLLRAGEPAPALPEPEPYWNWTSLACGGVCLFAYFVYVIFFFGVSGGPNKGEAPFMASLMHLGAFLMLGWGLERIWFWAYLALVVAAIALGMWALNLRVWSEPRRTWLGRGMMLALHGGCAAIILLGPGYAPSLRWAGHGALRADTRVHRSAARSS
jgi:hypothetical protein